MLQSPQLVMHSHTHTLWGFWEGALGKALEWTLGDSMRGGGRYLATPTGAGDGGFGSPQ